MDAEKTCIHVYVPRQTLGKGTGQKMSIFVVHCLNNMSLVMRKQAFCICENKDADQLRGNSEADQRLCFRYMDSTIPLLSKSKISSL